MFHVIARSKRSEVVVESSENDEIYMNRWGTFRLRSDIGQLEIVEASAGWEKFVDSVNKISSTFVVTIASFGPNFAAFVDNERNFWTLGLDFSACAKAPEKDIVSLRKMASHLDICKISVGEWHGLILTKAGDVFSFGRGSSGELGTGSRVSWQDELVRVQDISTCLDVAAGSSFPYNNCAPFKI